VGARAEEFLGEAMNQWTPRARSEVLTLTWQDIDLAAGTAYLRESKNRHARLIYLPVDIKQLLQSFPNPTSDSYSTTTANALRTITKRGIVPVKTLESPVFPTTSGARG